MPPFRFRLATLLRLREAARDERRAQLAEVLQLDEQIRRRLAEARDRLAESRQGRRQGVGQGRVDVDRLLAAARHELALEADEQGLVRQLEAIGVELERRREALVESDREVRTLENLRARHRRRHVREALRDEQRLVDEAALAPWTREVAP
jgi:flagellar export protein FliJ